MSAEYEVELQITRRLNPERHRMHSDSLLELLRRIEGDGKPHHVNAVWLGGRLVYSEFRPDTWPEGWHP